MAAARNMLLSRTFVATLVVAGVGMGTAFASDASAAVSRAVLPMQQSALLPGAPPGYQVVFTVLNASPNGTQTRAAAECPKGTVPFGGGVSQTSVNTRVSINSSFPTATGWDVDVNNASGAATGFQVMAVCGARPAHYAVVKSATVTQGAARQTTVGATCPAGAAPLGGGVGSNSTSLFVGMNSTQPTRHGWQVTESNATTSRPAIATFVVCGALTGYQVVHGANTPEPANLQTGTFVTCPAGKFPLGGGAASGSASVAVTLNSTFVSDITEWRSFVNNATAVANHSLSFVVCAGNGPA